MSDIVQFIYLSVDVLLIDQANPQDLSIESNGKHPFSESQTTTLQVDPVLFDHVTPLYIPPDLLIASQQDQVILRTKGKQILLVLLLSKDILPVVFYLNDSAIVGFIGDGE